MIYIFFNISSWLSFMISFTFNKATKLLFLKPVFLTLIQILLFNDLIWRSWNLSENFFIPWNSWYHVTVSNSNRIGRNFVQCMSGCTR